MSTKLEDLQDKIKERAIHLVDENQNIAKDNVEGVNIYYINLNRSTNRKNWMNTQEKDEGS